MASDLYEQSNPKVSAGSLVVDLLSTVPAAYSVSVGALVRAGALFGVGENSMRVSLARLRARGSVESGGRGLYRLSRSALPVNREVRSWASVGTRLGPWDGRWIGVETSTLARRDRRGARKSDRALRLLGFEALTPTLFVRPDNWVEGVEGCRKRLTRLGFEPSPIAFRLDHLDDETLARARALWDVTALEAGYRATRERLTAAAIRLPTLSAEAAMTESFRIGGEAVRQIVLDPLLPDAIVDTDARHAMIEAMRAYDVLGKNAWKKWAGESVELESSPIDSTGFEQPKPTAGIA